MNPEKKKSKKNVTRVGEYLVWAELARRGLEITPSSTNVPKVSFSVSDGEGRSLPVRLRTSSGPQFAGNVEDWMEIDFDQLSGRQTVTGPAPLGHPNLLLVLVSIDFEGRDDRFFILTMKELQGVIIDHHQAFLAKHDGIRPKKPESVDIHYGVDELVAFENRWDLIFQHFADAKV